MAQYSLMVESAQAMLSKMAADGADDIYHRVQDFVRENPGVPYGVMTWIDAEDYKIRYEVVSLLPDRD